MVLKQKSQEMMSTLSMLSLKTIITEIWNNSNMKDIIYDLAYKIKFVPISYSRTSRTPKSLCMRQIRNPIVKFYQRHYDYCIDSIYHKIMNLNTIGSRTKQQIALTLIKLEESILEAVLEALEEIQFENKEDIKYFISKIIIDDNFEVNRQETVLKLFYDSFFSIQFNLGRINVYCSLHPDRVQGLLQDMKYVANWSVMRSTVYDIVYNMQDMNIFYVWQSEANEFRDSDGTNKLSKLKVFNHVAVFAHVNILKHYCCRMKNKYKPQYFTSAVVSILLSKQWNHNNLVYLLENLPQKYVLIILNRFHKDLFEALFESFNCHYCLLLFKLLLANNDFHTCKTVIVCLAKLLYKGFSENNLERKKIMKTTQKQVFCSLWCNLPANVKNRMDRNLYSILGFCIQYNDSDVLAMLVNDFAFTKKKKVNILLHLTVDIILEYDHAKLSNFLKLFSDTTLDDINDILTIGKLKLLLLKTSKNKTNYKDLDTYLKSINQFDMKAKLRNDKQFLVKMIASLLQYDLLTIQKFLDWCFNENKDDIAYLRNVQIKDNLWITDIYKNYLLTIKNLCVLPEQDLFKYFNIDSDTCDNIKEQLRNDKVLVNTLFEKITKNDFCDVSKILHFLFNEKQQKEQREFFRNYLLSETGLKTVCTIFQTNYYNDDLYLLYSLDYTLEYYYLIQKYWFKPYKGIKQELRDLLNINRPEARNKDIQLLPFETKRANEIIVDAKFRIFKKICRSCLTLKDSKSFMKEQGKCISLFNLSNSFHRSML